MVILAWLGLGIAAQFSAGAAPAEPVAAASPTSFTFGLSRQDLDHARVLQTVGVRLQRAAFQKEPPLAGRDVFRGSLLWFNRPEQAMPFIWDKGRGRLYLDLNRDGDLTEDAKGVFASTAGASEQSFTNVPLLHPTARGNRSVRLEVSFNSDYAGSVRVNAGVSSYWGGQVSLRGQDWQFGLMESMVDGTTSGLPDLLVLRPWAEHQRPLQLNYSTPDGFDYTRTLFFGGRAYELDCRYVPGGESPKYTVTFKEQAPRLGELSVTGTNLHRLILTTRPGMTVVLDQPQGIVKLPVGDYSLAEIWLRKGEAEVGSFRAGRVNVDAQRPASLVAGGPLTNCVVVSSQRDNLQINYKLLGADGRAYTFPRPDYEHPPEFAIFQGTNRLATGKFRYG